MDELNNTAPLQNTRQIQKYSLKTRKVEIKFLTIEEEKNRSYLKRVEGGV